MDLSNYQQPKKQEKKKEKKRGEARTQQQELIDKFILSLNTPSREKAGYRPYTYPRVARMLKGLDNHQLFILHNDCSQARQFGSVLKRKLEERKLSP